MGHTGPRRGLRLVIILITVALIATLIDGAVFRTPMTAHAQGSISVTMEGTVESITGDTWVVAGTTFKITATTTIEPSLGVGSTVRITATANSDNTFTAIVIVLVVLQPTTEPTVEPTTEPTAAPTASPTASPPVTYVKIIIEGPVESIDLTVNVVVVYGFRVRLRADDPIRLKIKVRDWIRVSGDLEWEDGARFIVIAVVVVIIDAPRAVIIVRPPAPGSNSGGDDDDDDDDDD